MGGAASVAHSSATQAELDAAVESVLQPTYDRVLVRAHYAKVYSGKEIDAKLSFLVLPIDDAHKEYTPVLPDILTGADCPPNAAAFFARKTSDNPTWNQEELLLFQRGQASPSIPKADTPISSRVLEVKLENVKQLKERVLDQITAAAESTQKFFLRNIERFMTDIDHRDSPLVDSAAEDIDGTTPSAVEVIRDVHQLPLPAPAEGWVFHKLEGEHAAVYISIKTSFAEDTISSQDQLRTMESCMTEVLLDNLSHGNKALLRHVQRPGNKRAMLWIPGFNDSFHNHVYANALLGNGYDVWILDLRRCGACRRAFPGSTSPVDYHHTTDLKEYFEEIEKSVELMKNRTPHYDNIVGYSHSTGAIVMLNYALEFTDSQFSGFIFNSPFLDWGYTAGQMINQKAPWQKKRSTVTALNTGQMRKHSMYNFDTNTQTLYSLRIADDWVAACERMHKIIQERDMRHPITRKPFLVLASRNAKCLSSAQLMEYSKRIGPTRTVVQMNFGSHDCISSYDQEKVDEAISYVLTWLKGNVGSSTVPIVFKETPRILAPDNC